MNAIYLRFADPAEALQHLPLPDVEAGEAPPAWQRARDDVGTISMPTGKTTTVDGTPVPETAALPGWHINLLVDELPPELQPFVVEPLPPQRRFAGF